MIRFLLTVTIYASIARFLCTEAVLIAPFTKPAINAVVQWTTIPPHTQWNKEKIALYAERVLPEQNWVKEFATDERPLEKLAEKARNTLLEMQDSGLKEF